MIPVIPVDDMDTNDVEALKTRLMLAKEVCAAHREDMARLVEERDALVAACKRAEFAFRVPATERIQDQLEALALMRQAIDKAESR